MAYAVRAPLFQTTIKTMPLSLANPRTNSQTTDFSQTTHRCRILDAPAPLRLWHLASLDAPTVAVVWSLAFARTASIDLPAWVPVLLALGTWAVYIGDRLLDARSASRAGDLSCLRERHFFHWRLRRSLTPIAVTAAGISALIIFTQMPLVLRERDLGLAVAAIAYFSGVHLPRKESAKRSFLFSKEFLVGVLFTAGCAIPTLSRLNATAIPVPTLCALLVSVAFFAVLAWLNCQAIERWESDTASHISAYAVQLGCIGVVFAVFFFHGTWGEALLITGSAASLMFALLDRFRAKLTPLALRVAADLVLLTPLLLLAR
jgi:hypothetical protein